MASKSEIIALFKQFEEYSFKFQGVDAWRARVLMPALGYANWQNFREAITRAWASCEAAEQHPEAHFIVSDGSKPWRPDEVFTEASKNPQGGRPSEDVILTRLGAYLVAMNGDPNKSEIAFAQHYFAAATRSAELIEQRLSEAARLVARGKLMETEKRFSGVLFEAGVDGAGIGRIRSSGDRVLFGGRDTEEMKARWGVKGSRALADFAPEVLVIAKQLGAAMTTHNVGANGLQGEVAISKEHIANNSTVRQSLLSRNIVPEMLKPEEDIKKVERRHASEVKKLAKSAPKKPK